MSAKFYTLMTDIGAAKLASAAALGIPLKITQMAVGDGGGSLPTPDAKQTALVAEKRRAALNMLYIDPQNSSQIIAEQVIPETEGGWWIREVGLFDETGALIAVGNCPESYKPQLVEGSGRTQTVRMVLITSSTDNITLKIDPSVVLATRGYVDSLIETRQQKSDTLTALAGLKPTKGKFPYFTAEKAAALAELSDFIRPMLGKADAAGVLEYLGLRESFSGVVGQSRNARMSVITVSSSATFTADELIVESSTGKQYRLSAFDKTINIATAGAGGMDTGSVPASGFIAIYAILNPTNGSTALLAVNATATTAPEIYSGTNMPVGYTASALVSVWRVASGQFTVGEMMGRLINTPEQSLVTVTNTVSTLTELSISSAIPKNAKTMEGWGLINSTQAAANNSFAVSSKPYSLGLKTHGSGNSGVSSVFSNLIISEPQKIYYQIGFGGTPTPSTIYSTGYSF